MKPAKRFDLHFQYREAKKNLAYLFDHGDVDLRLRARVLSLRKKVIAKKLVIAKDLFRRARPFMTFGLVCGKHWQAKDVAKPNEFIKRHGITEVNYVPHPAWEYGAFDEDWISICVTMTGPFKYIVPWVDINGINCLFEGTAKMKSDPHSMYFIGKYRDEFCHFDIFYKDVVLPENK